MGAPGLPEQVREGESYKEGQFGLDDMVEITNLKYGEIIAVTHEMIEDDQTKRVIQQPNRIGAGHKKFEDKITYSILTANATAYDSQAFFSLNHPGITGGGAIAANDNILTAVTLSANAIAQALGIMARWTGASADDILDVTAKNLVVPKNLKYTANILTQSAFLPLAFAAGVLGPGATTGQAKNVLADENLGVISSARLDSSSTTDWYIWSDFPGLIFQTREPLKLLAESEESGTFFERDVRRWKSRKRFRIGVINWRVGMLIS